MKGDTKIMCKMLLSMLIAIYFVYSANRSLDMEYYGCATIGYVDSEALMRGMILSIPFAIYSIYQCFKFIPFRDVQGLLQFPDTGMPFLLNFIDFSRRFIQSLDFVLQFHPVSIHHGGL